MEERGVPWQKKEGASTPSSKPPSRQSESSTATGAPMGSSGKRSAWHARRVSAHLPRPATLQIAARHCVARPPCTAPLLSPSRSHHLFPVFCCFFPLIFLLPL